MKRVLLFILLMVNGLVNAQNTFQIIPQPVKITAISGEYIITKSTTISFNNEGSKKIADLFVADIANPTGINLKAKKGTSGNIQFILNEQESSDIKKEGYLLEANNNGIKVTANDEAGLYYGLQTILQLLPKEIESTKLEKAKWSIPGVKIEDYPRFAWRGLMLDVSRHFFSVEDVKSYIDQMAHYKYNTFHWHLTDDNGWRIEIKSLPKLTEVGAWRVERHGDFGEREKPKPGEEKTYGGFYSQEQVKDIVQYAKERYVTIIPEIDVPGHSMAAIAAYPELSCTKDPNIWVDPGSNFSEWYGNGTFKMLVDNTLNPADEKVYDFLDQVFTEVAELFPNPYIHVGGDECYKGYWEKNEECRALMKKIGTRHVEDLQGYFMGRVQEILASKGKKMIGWDEIMEGGVSSDAAVMAWRSVEKGIEAAENGHKVVMSPTAYCYIDYYQGERTIEPPIYAGLRLSKSYGFEPVPEGIDPSHIMGGQANLWTEQVPTLRYADYMTYPRAWALSEVFWSPSANKNWNQFVQKTEAHFQRFDMAELNYSKAMYDPIISTSLVDGQLQIEMQSEVPEMKIFYSIDDTMPDDYSTVYKNPFVLPEGPITLRVVAYRNGRQLSHLITLSLDQLRKRAK